MKRLFNLFVLMIILSGCQNTDKQSLSEPSPIPVHVITVTRSEGNTSRTYVGNVEATRSAILLSKYGGTLEDLPVTTHQHIKSGDVLAIINSSAVKSAYEMAAASLHQAEDGYQRAKQVYESGSIPEVQWVEINTRLNQAKASANAAEAALEECRIKAPFDGMVAKIYTHKGMEVAVGEPILQMIDAREVQLKISIPEKEYAQLKIGDKAWFDVPALGVENIPATLTQKGLVASSLTHSYEGILVPDQPVIDLTPGMVAKVRLTKDNKSGILLPISSIRLDVNGRYVWSVKDSKAMKTPIYVEGFQGDGILVTSGLQAGDQVIIAGGEKISSGMMVDIIQE